ncbi:hypothetical protein D3C81_1099690 [compost metagenome]
MAAVGLWSGVRGSARLWPACRVRRAGAARLRDGRAGAVVAPALSSSWRRMAVVAGVQRCAVAGPARQFASGFVALVCGGGGVDLYLWRPLGCVALVADLDAGAVVDRDRLMSGVAGAESADQPQRAAGQFACSALGQSCGVTAGAAWNRVAACSFCRRRPAVAGRRFDRWVVSRAGDDCRALAGMDRTLDTRLGLGHWQPRRRVVAIAARRAAASIGLAVVAAAGRAATRSDR